MVATPLCLFSWKRNSLFYLGIYWGNNTRWALKCEDAEARFLEGRADVRKAEKRKSENLKTRKVGRSCERLEAMPSQALPRA